MLEKAAELLSDIHEVLRDFEDLPEGIGENFFKYRKPEQVVQSFHNSLQTAAANGDDDNVRDIRDILEIIEHFPDYHFDVSKFTCGNTHGDYMISQMLCGDNSIKGIIDWTTACRHPLIWEVVRSYIFMAPECKDGAIDIESFEHTRNRSIYLEQAQLSAKMLRWFDKHIEELNVRLRKLAEAM